MRAYVVVASSRSCLVEYSLGRCSCVCRLLPTDVVDHADINKCNVQYKCICLSCSLALKPIM